MIKGKTSAPKHFVQLPVSILRSRNLTSTDKLVFEVIHTMLNSNEKFYMSNGTLANYIGMGRSSVIHSIHRLISCKLICSHKVTKNNKNIGRVITEFGGQYNNHPIYCIKNAYENVFVDAKTCK